MRSRREVPPVPSEPGECSRTVNPLLLWLASVLLIWPAAADWTPEGDVLIFFDQSASMPVQSPQFDAGQCLMPLIRVFPESCDLLIVAFAESTQCPVRVTAGDAEQLAALQATLAGLEPFGRTSDLEAPLRFLLDHDGEIAVAIVITDGQPDIWDDRRWHLNTYVQSDGRYEECNAAYRRLKAQGRSAKALHRELGSAYAERNLALIEKDLVQLRRKLGSRLVFLDTSGKYDYLRHWATLAAAELIVAPFPVGQVEAQRLYKQIVSLQQQVERAIPSPADLSLAREGHSAVPGPPPVPATGHRMQFVLIPVVGLAIISVVLLFRKRWQRGVLANQMAVNFQEPKPAREPARRAERLPGLFVDQEFRSPRSDRRVQLRVPVPEGAMMVYWKDPAGRDHSGPAVDISMGWVALRAREFDARGIERIYLPRTGATFNVKRSSVQRLTADRAVIKLEEFAGAADDRMRWVELLTRMEQAA